MPAADFSCILHIRVKMNTQPAFGMSPCASMEETYYSPVPCQRISGGFFSSSTSTGIEWPWFARISVCSFLYGFLLLICQIFASVPRKNAFFRVPGGPLSAQKQKTGSPFHAIQVFFKQPLSFLSLLKPFLHLP